MPLSLPVPVPAASRSASAGTLHLVLLGTGVVGGHLLKLLAQRPAEALPQVRLAAVANSRRMVVDPAGLDPARAKASLPHGDPLNLRALAELGQTLTQPVLVDCTSAEAVVDAYGRFADAGFHLATANKKLASGPLERLRDVQARLAARGRAFRNETNVGAGLPVLSTLRDLQAGGDRVLRIEGVLSGSLSFLCGRLQDGVLFSEALAEAHRNGFTEPDPREDLSGLDVARKVLILHRELGGQSQLAEVAVESLLPPGFAEGESVEAFLRRSPELDATFAQRLAELRARGEVLRIVGVADANGAQVGLQALPASHPLAAVRDGENALAITSEAYAERPLVVRGYGAGAAVTAIGLLADLLKVGGPA